MKSNNSNPQGFTLIEVLLSTVVLSITSVIIFSSLNNVNSSKDLYKAGANLYTLNQITQQSIGNIMQDFIFQLQFKQNKPEVDYGYNNVGEQCKFPTGYQPYGLTVKSSEDVEKIAEKEEDEWIWTGSETIAQSITPISPYSFDLNTNYPSVYKSVLTGNSSPLKTAMERCRESMKDNNYNLVMPYYYYGAGSSNSADFTNTSEFYFCGSINNSAFVEVKAKLWDFNTNEALTCLSSIGRPGRGFKVFYNIFSYNSKKKKDGNYLVKSSQFSSSIDIPKMVFQKENEYGTIVVSDNSFETE